MPTNFVNELMQCMRRGSSPRLSKSFSFESKSSPVHDEMFLTICI